MNRTELVHVHEMLTCAVCLGFAAISGRKSPVDVRKRSVRGTGSSIHKWYPVWILFCVDMHVMILVATEDALAASMNQSSYNVLARNFAFKNIHLPTPGRE
jgi:hypothetical protein